MKLWVNIGNKGGLLGLKIVYYGKILVIFFLEDAGDFAKLKFKQLENEANINFFLIKKMYVEKFEF